MKVRTLRRIKSHNFTNMRHSSRWCTTGTVGKHVAAAGKLADSLRIKEEELQAAVEYAVARKKDGVIVGTYGTLAEANEVIEKAKAQKKAALILV